MESVFRSKKVLKPDVPPPRMGWSSRRVGNGFLYSIFGILCVGILLVVMVILMV